MIEKRNLTQYEKIILASAYNVKNYCRDMHCEKCIFRDDKEKVCILKACYPSWWYLHKVERGEKE